MTALSLLEDVFQSPTVVAEALLIGLLLALVGAGGYVFFIFSMKDDRADKRMERFSNPWDKVSGGTEAAAPRGNDRGKTTVILCVLMAVLVVLICLLLAILLGWI